MLTRKLLPLVDLRLGEGYRVGLLVGYTFCAYATDLLIYTAAYSLFLNTFDAQRLPYIYIGVSLCTVLLASLYLRLSQRYTLAQLLTGQSALLLLTIIGYRSGLVFMPNRWLLFSLPIWHGVVNALLYLTHWNLMGRLFNLQQGKRLFGLFGAATQITGLLVGFLTPGLVMLVGPTNLLWIAAMMTSGGLAILATLIRQNAALSALEPAPDEAAPIEPITPTPLLREPYVQLIFVLLICYALGSYLIDNLFYNRVENYFTDENALAGFLGLFNGVNSGLSLLAQLWVANRLLNRYGVRTVVILTPLLLTVGLLLFALAGLTFGATALLFWLITLVYLVMQVLADTDNTAANLLYQPLPAALRNRLQTIADGIISPGAIGLAGLILLLLTEFFQATVLQLAAVALPILAVWALAGWALGRGYGQRVQQALRQRLIQGQRTFTPDRDSLAIIRQNLSNPQPGAALYALDLLAAVDSRALAQALPSLLNHPSVPVRLEALQRLERVGDADLLPLLRHCSATDADPAVRHAALRTLAALDGLTHLEELEGYLQSPDLDQRQSVLVGLLRSGDLDAILAVGETLGRLIQSPDRTERLLAARLLGESGVTSFYRPLLRLIHDPDLGVQRAALIAAGKLQQPKLWPAILDALRDPQTRAAAHRALSIGGEAALPALTLALADCTQGNPSPTVQERRFLVEIVRLFGRLRAPAASASLLPLFDLPGLPSAQPAFVHLAAARLSGHRCDATTHRRTVSSRTGPRRLDPGRPG
jgi:ATP/ADP translocase/HEAT repeat protein